MALLQISEPGESPVPHQRKLAVGIDLGTTHSLVAAVRSSVPEVLADAEGRVLLPSVARYLADGGIQVGYEAQAQQTTDSANTISSVKRLVGRSLTEARREGAAYEFSDDEGVKLKTAQGDITPIEISGHILSVLRQRAEQALGGDLIGAVITVPAYFDDAQRQATRDAGRLAGLTVLRLLNEPTAAAIAYGLDHGAEGVYAVYDLGGGTFDISILRLTKGVFEVVATGGDTQLGGDDFDQLIVEQLVGQTRLSTLSKADLRRLLVVARQVREALSEQDEALFEVVLSDGEKIAQTVSAPAFNAWALPLLKRTLETATRALRDAGLETEQVKGVVLVGGATRMPIVRREVAALFGTQPLTDLDPDRVVALGAALQANLLAGNRNPDNEWLLLDVTPLSLGLETMGGLVERVIPRNSTIPVARAQEFTTFKDGQTAMSIHVVQGERDLVPDCRSLARFELRGIPPMVAGAARIQVTFQVDADGLLHVGAREESTGVEASVSVKPSYGLSDDEVASMLAAGMDNASSDAHARAVRVHQVDLRQVIESVNAAVASDGDLLSADEHETIAKLLKRAGRVLIMDDVDTLRKMREELGEATDSFAARRMDRSIRAALAGKTLDELAK